MADAEGAIVGSGVEMVEVVAVHNVLGLRYGDRAFVPVNTPELAACLERDLVRLVVDGMEQVPERSQQTAARRCCGG